MTAALNILAVQNAALLRELAKEGPAETVAAIARRIGRDESNVRKSIKLLVAEGLAEDPMCLTRAGEAQLAAIDRAEGPTQAQGGEPGSSGAEGILSLVHAQILPDPANDRRDWDSDEARDDLDNLRQDIIQNDLLQNLIVRAVAPDDLQGVSIEAVDELTGQSRTLPLYRLVAGERRWRAIGEAITDGDWDPNRTIPCRLLETDDLGHRLAALAENLQRRNLNPIEKARAFEGLAEAGLTNQEIADRISATPEHVQQHRRFLQLDEADQQRMTMAKDDPRHLSVRDARQKLAKKADDKPPELSPEALRVMAEVGHASRKADASSWWVHIEVAPDAIDDPAVKELMAAEILDVSGPGYGTGRYKAGYRFGGWKIAGALIPWLKEGATEEERDGGLHALHDASGDHVAADAYLTPWLNGPFELTPEGQAIVDQRAAEDRERSERVAQRKAETEARAIRWRAARDRHIELFAEAVTKPVWGEPAQTIEIAAAIDHPLPWSVTTLGKVQDANGNRVSDFGHWQGCTDQGLVTAHMIVAAVNAAGGLATPAAEAEPEEADEPEQDIDGNDPDAEAVDDDDYTFEADEAEAVA